MIGRFVSRIFRCLRTPWRRSVSERERPAPEDHWRQEAIGRFAEWLNALANEEVGAIREEAQREFQSPDLFALYGELSALRQDVRLQSTAARKAGQALETAAEILHDGLRERLDSVMTTVTEAKSMLPEARREGEETVLLELLSVRESLARVTVAADAGRLPRRPWMRQHARVFDELRSGQHLVLDRLDDVLRRMQVVPAVKAGMAFDPAVMRAVSTSRDTGAREGDVTRVVRQGYQRNGKVLQIAEVQVEKQT